MDKHSDDDNARQRTGPVSERAAQLLDASAADDLGAAEQQELDMMCVQDPQLAQERGELNEVLAALHRRLDSWQEQPPPQPSRPRGHAHRRPRFDDRTAPMHYTTGASTLFSSTTMMSIAALAFSENSGPENDEAQGGSAGDHPPASPDSSDHATWRGEQAAAEEAVEAISSQGGRSFAMHADVTEEQQVGAFFEESRSTSTSYTSS